MERPIRPDFMSDIEWLVALEEIRQLKARRDRYIDSGDLDAYEALHAPDHVSVHAPDHIFDGAEATWNSPTGLREGLLALRKGVNKSSNIHQSHGYDINFETPEKARGIWAMTGAHVVVDDEGKDEWEISFGYYYETYEKRDGRWLFTTRRWLRYFGMGSARIMYPREMIKDSNAFDEFDAMFGKS